MKVCKVPRRATELGSAFEYLTSVKCCGCTKIAAIRAAGPEAVAISVQAAPTLTALSVVSRRERSMDITFALTVCYTSA
jgi:hypothetical protein